MSGSPYLTTLTLPQTNCEAIHIKGVERIAFLAKADVWREV